MQGKICVVTNSVMTCESDGSHFSKTRTDDTDRRV